MRSLSPAMAAALSREATTLARCWRLARHDGLVLGFTDHDRDLAFEGTRFEAASGVEGGEAEGALGFAVGGSEIAGALSSGRLTEDDLAKGLWDDCGVGVWLVDWTNVEARLLLEAGSLGEIRRGDHAFKAELRGLAHRLDEERGRLFTASCSADLGDARCRVPLGDPRFHRVFAVEAVDEATLAWSGLAGVEEGWFTGGRLVWLSGANAGAVGEVRLHRAGSLALWREPPAPVAAGDQARVEAGCDKSFSSCRAKFGNVANFRGFPHMPGNELLLTVAQNGQGRMDGGSLFR